jgi:hypothetical protein
MRMLNETAPASHTAWEHHRRNLWPADHNGQIMEAWHGMQRTCWWTEHRLLVW